MEERKCYSCERPARVAIRTTRPSRDDLRSTIFFDDRSAPKTATPYCREHGADLAKSLVETLADRDEEGVRT